MTEIAVPQETASARSQSQGSRGRGRPPTVQGRIPVLTLAAILGVTFFVSKFAQVGADAEWIVALGDHIVRHRSVPEGIPFAAAPSAGWPNTTVLAQTIFFAVAHPQGVSGLVVLQIGIVAAVLLVLAQGARAQGAWDAKVAWALILFTAGALPALVIVRAQVLSLLPFALLLLLLRSEEASATRRIWLLPPLLAVWSNLHGAVLVGATIAGTYLVLSRLRIRFWETLSVGSLCLLALLATPAHWRTLDYYTGVLGNEAASRGSELWARPDPSDPLDLLLILSATLLLAFALRRPRPIWEYFGLVSLAIGTAVAARYGVWLLMLAVAPAASGMAARQRPAATPRMSRALPVMLVVGGLPALLVGVMRGNDVLPASPTVVEAVTHSASGRVVLAPEPLVESLAVAGAKVWMCDPIDAFSGAHQRRYLDFLEGRPGGRDALVHSDLVVVSEGSPSASLVSTSPDFVVERRLEGWVLYGRRSP